MAAPVHRIVRHNPFRFYRPDDSEIFRKYIIMQDGFRMDEYIFMLFTSVPAALVYCPFFVAGISVLIPSVIHLIGVYSKDLGARPLPFIPLFY